LKKKAFPGKYPGALDVAGFLRPQDPTEGDACMRGRWLGLIVVGLCSLPTRSAQAQWGDPQLIFGQVAFNVAASFVGKVLLHHQAPGPAIKSALVEGAASGLVAHTGYCVAGRHPHMALVGKALAQKSSLMTRRSMNEKPVFDRSLLTHWQITHSFVYIQIEETARVEIDVLNAAGAAYFLFSENLQPELGRTLYTGSMFFRNKDPEERIRGFAIPGAIWMADSYYDDKSVLGHELVHALQNERGSAVADWHYKGLRFNLLALAPGVPALFEGWPEHDRRLHEREANLYAGRE
jgi:hypothetical protein